MIDEIRQQVEEVTYTIEKSPKDQNYTLALTKDNKKIYVLSKYQPQQHAVKMLGEDFGNTQTIWILFGFGFGYMLQQLLTQVGEETKIIIIEPDETLLKEQMNLEDWEPILNKSNIKYFSGYDFSEIYKIFETFIPEAEVNNIKIKAIDSYLVYYNKYYAKIINCLDERIMKPIINNNTIFALDDLCTKNAIANRYAMKQGYDLSVHRNKYKDIPALIVSAGPSLQKNIEAIKQFKGIIFCMGRTLTPIMEQGITPDFVACVDPTEKIYETFNKHKEFNVPLIAISTSNKKVIKGSKGPTYFLSSTGIVDELMKIKTNPILNVSGTVATLCLSSAQYMGCNPIMFIGQDFAYTNNKYHSDLASNDQIGLGINQLKIDENKSGLKSIKAFDGGSVYSDDVMIGFLRWFENHISNHPETTFINATEGGAYMNGALHMAFQEAIVQYMCQKPVIIHELLKDNAEVEVDSNLIEGIKNLEELRNDIFKVEKYYAQLIEEYKVYKGERLGKITKIAHKIDQLNKEVLEVKKGKEIVQMLIEKIRIKISINNDNKQPIDESEQEKRLRYVRLNYIFYKELNKAIQEMTTIIKGEMQNETHSFIST